jgi:hypothetical protein
MVICDGNPISLEHFEGLREKKIPPLPSRFLKKMF